MSTSQKQYVRHPTHSPWSCHIYVINGKFYNGVIFESLVHSKSDAFAAFVCHSRYPMEFPCRMNTDEAREAIRAVSHLKVVFCLFIVQLWYIHFKLLGVWAIWGEIDVYEDFLFWKICNEKVQGQKKKHEKTFLQVMLIVHSIFIKTQASKWFEHKILMTE